MRCKHNEGTDDHRNKSAPAAGTDEDRVDDFEPDARGGNREDVCREAHLAVRCFY